jgi:hypothetical protein
MELQYQSAQALITAFLSDLCGLGQDANFCGTSAVICEMRRKLDDPS